MTNPEINSAEFFGLEPGTPEYEKFQGAVVPDSIPDVSPDIEGFIPPKLPNGFELTEAEKAVIEELSAKGEDTRQAITGFQYDRIG